MTRVPAILVLGLATAGGAAAPALAADPALTLSAPATVPIGAGIAPGATLAGGDEATGTIVVRAWTTADCSGPAALESEPVAVAGDGEYRPATLRPTALGSLRWRATYSGDAGNTAAVTACGDAQTTVERATPAIAATASDGSVGTPVVDEGALSEGYAPTGAVTFRAWADPACAGLPAFTASAPVREDGTFTSPAFIPLRAGTYAWIASYAGDEQNASAATACGDRGQISTITQAGLSTEERVDLGDVTVGSASAVRVIVVRNPASGPTAEDLDFAPGAVALDGAGFALVADGCSATAVAPGASCTFAVRFAPAAAGAAGARVTLTSDAAGSPHVVTLAGRGVVPAPPPAAPPAPAPAAPASAPAPVIRGLYLASCLRPERIARRLVQLHLVLDEPARVTLRLQRRVRPAVRAPGRCPRAAPGAGGVFGPVSPALGAPARTLTRRAGFNRIGLTALTGARRLPPGGYRVTVTSTAPGRATARRTLSFWVLR